MAAEVDWADDPAGPGGDYPPVGGGSDAGPHEDYPYSG